MPFTSKLAKLILTTKEKGQLEVIAKSRTTSKQRIEQAIILLSYAGEETGTVETLSTIW